MSSAIPWGTALAVFIGTAPILGAILWNLMSVRDLGKKLDALNEKVSSIDKRLAVLEERDRWTHPVVGATQ